MLYLDHRSQASLAWLTRWVGEVAFGSLNGRGDAARLVSLVLEV